MKKTTYIRIIKKVFLLFLLVLCVKSNYAQKATIKWGEEFELKDKESKGLTMYFDGEYLYQQSFVSRGSGNNRKITPAIVKLDKSLKEVQKEDYSTNKDDLKFNGMFYFGGGFLMITSYIEKSTNTTEIYLSKIDKSTLRIIGSPVTIWKLSAPAKRKIKWETALSPDSSSLLLFSDYEQKDDENYKFAYKVVNKDLKVINEKAVSFESTVENFPYHGLNLSNNGDFYIAGKQYLNGTKKETISNGKTKKASYKFNITKYPIDGESKTHFFDIGNNLLLNFYMKSDGQTNDLFLLSIYSEIDKNEEITGYLFNRFSSKTGEIIETKKNNFDLSLINRCNEIEDFKSHNNKPGISNYFSISDFIITNENKIYAMLEHRYNVWHSTKYGSYYTYYSNSIIAFELDKSGNQKWINLIPKKQYYSSYTGFIYYSTMIYKDRFMIFYNDIEKNLDYDLSSDKAPKTFNAMKEMNLMMIDIDSKGKMTRKECTNSDKSGTTFRIQGCKQVSDNHFYINGFEYKSEKFKNGMLIFE